MNLCCRSTAGSVDRAGSICARGWRRSCTCWPLAARGAPCPRTSRRAQWCKATSTAGATPSPRSASSTARVWRSPKAAARAGTTPPSGSRSKSHTVTEGFLLAALVHPADVQDCHGVVLLRALGRSFPKLRHIFAERVYRGQQLLNALADCVPWMIEIVQRPKGVKGFQMLPRRRVVERTFAWIGRCSRLAKDFEAAIASATAWLLIAHLRLLTQRLTRP